MYTTNMELFKVQQRELHRQATEFRLAKSLLVSSRNRKGYSWSRRLAQPAQSSKYRNNAAG